MKTVVRLSNRELDYQSDLYRGLNNDQIVADNCFYDG